VPGRDLDGVHFAMEFLPQQNKVRGRRARWPTSRSSPPASTSSSSAAATPAPTASARRTATARRRSPSSSSCRSRPIHENKPLVWPNWPIKLRTSSSHEEGCDRDWSVTTKRSRRIR
jgi:glutamate synthase (NADPH/NADH) small chain